jgi:predicted transcriptional regulator
MADSTYVGDYFDVNISIEIEDKKTGQLIKKFNKRLESDNDSETVIHDFDVDLHGFISCHFTKLKLGLRKD